MTSPSYSFLVGVDGSDNSEQAFQQTLNFLQPEDTLLVVHLFDPDKQDDLPESKLKADFIKQNYEVHCAGLPPGSWHVKLVACSESQSIHNTVISLANEYSVNFLVIGLHSANEAGKLPTIMGDSDYTSLRSAKCAVILCKPTHTPLVARGQSHFMTGVDGSPMGVHAVHTALSLMSNGDRLSIVHIKQPSEDSEMIEKLELDFKELFEKKGIKAEFVTIEKTGKSTSRTITEYARDSEIDHLVIGCDGMRAYAQKHAFLGSVTDVCVKHARCNIVVAQTYDLTNLERP
eukprot:780062_1